MRTRRASTRSFADQRGFTMVELLVVMFTGIIIFSAALGAIEVFARSSEDVRARNDAQDRARLAADAVVRQLRNVTSTRTSPKLIERANSYDLVFQTVGTPSGSNTGGIQRVRYCIPQDSSAGTASNEVLYRQTQTWTSASAPSNPWPQATASIACPDPSRPSVAIANSVTNRYQMRTDRPAFSFNGSTTAPSDLATITLVGMDLYINVTPQDPALESRIQSAALLRNQNRPPSAAINATTPGGGHVLLNGGVSADPDGETLSFAWSCSSTNCTSTDNAFLGNNRTPQIDWTPQAGPGTYTIVLTVTDQGGLSSTTSQTVTVV